MRAARETMKDAGRYFPVRGAHAVVSVVSIILFARVMRPEGYGTFVVLLAWSAVCSTIVFNWVTASSFRFYQEAASANDVRRFGANLLGAYLFCAVVWLLAGAAFVGYVAFAGGFVSVSAAVFLVLLGLCDPIIVMYQSVRMASRRVGSVGVVVLADSCLRALLGALGAVLMDDVVAGVLAGQLVGAASIAAVIIIRAGGLVQWPANAVSADQIAAFLRYGYPMAGITLSSWVLSVSDRMIVAWVLGSAAAGVYAVGYQLGSNAILFPSSSLMAGAFPILIREHDGAGKKAASALLGRLLVIALAGGLAIVLAMGVGAHRLVALLFGAEYAGAAIIVPIVAAGHLIFALSDYFAKAFQLAKATSNLFRITLVAAAANVLANFAFVPEFGIVGAAVATVLSYGIALGLTASGAQRHLRVAMPADSAARIGASLVVPLMIVIWAWPRELSVAHAVLVAVGTVSLFIVTLRLTNERNVVSATHAALQAVRSRSLRRS